jgi:pimeloyl-ACP methyl ester carboxylesterase
MRVFGRFLGWVVGLGILVAAVVYLRPVWVSLQVTHLTFALKGVQSDYVETPEGRIHYYDAEARTPGGGAPLVLVHGLGDRSEAWAAMIPKLRDQGFHVYALDLLGYGRSPKPSDADYSMALQEKVVADFIKGLGLPKTDVAGWSMGGWATLLLGLDHTEMVNRLVVFDAVGVEYPRTYPDTVFHPTNEAELDRLVHLLEPNAKPLSHFIAQDALRKFAGQQWVIDRGIAAMLTRKDALDDRLGKLQVPLLIVWGADDKLLPLATVGEKMHALDPNSELDVMQGCGHLVPAVCTGQAVSAVTDFLKAEPAKVGGMRTWGPSPKR